MTFYQVVLVLKFLGVMGFSGGALASVLPNSKQARKWSAHRIASPCLLITWLCGYILVVASGLPLFELWIVGALALSFISNACASYAASRDLHLVRVRLWLFGSLFGVVVLMVTKPTWRLLSP